MSDIKIDNGAAEKAAVAWAKVAVSELAARLLEKGEKVVVLLIGAPASGKSTLSGKLRATASFAHLNADSIRAEVTGDENNHDSDNLVWMKFYARYEAALQGGGPVLIDNLNHTRAARSGLIRAARKAGYAVKLVFLDVPLAVCIERNKARGKDIADYVIMEKHVAMKVEGKPLDDEDAIWIRPTADADSYLLSARAQTSVGDAFDIIGDVHGCADELLTLIAALGYKLDLAKGTLARPQGRRLVFVGDLTDRGPNSALVLEIVMKLHRLGALVVRGNHCEKLLRLLQGHQVKMDEQLAATVAQIRARPDFEQQVLLFLASLPYIYENKDLIVVHAAYKQLARGEKAQSLALYGETSGKKGANGFPERLDAWESAYMGGKTIVHGHVPVKEPTLRQVYNGGRIVNVDTACCFGGKLTALRFPEMEFISTPAAAKYSHWHFPVEAVPEVSESDSLTESGDTSMQTDIADQLSGLVAPVVWPGAFGIGVGLPHLAEFDEMERAGWIWSKRLKVAGEEGRTLRLFNYSKGCAYERVWNPVTTVSRGLIICEESGEVVAASMPKFYNLGETVAPGVVASVKEGSFEALVKLDGSCGIGYRLGGGYRWATRGSFYSSQAAVAQAMWDAKYAHNNELMLGEWNHLTLICEIIHPETRVVCRYDFEDLVLIAARDRFSGADLSYEELLAIGERLGMPVVERIDGADVDTLVRRAETLDDNSEGFVFHWPCGHRVKVKGTEYKRLHRLLSGITPRELANAWFDGTIGELLRIMPEEFREETEALVRQLDGNAVELARQTEEVYAQAGDLDQRAFAAWVKSLNSRLAAFLFNRRQQQAAGGAALLARAAVGNLFAAGQLEELLAEDAASESGEFAEALGVYVSSVSSYLWEATRNQQDVGKARGVAASLPKGVRGSFDTALSNLLPHLIVEKMRDFVRSANVPELSGMDVDAIFAGAPPSSAPEGIHNQWVFAQPSLLRSFLDRYRFCGKRETAVAGARKLLGDAIRTGAAEEYLLGIGRALARQGDANFDQAAVVARIVSGLKRLEERLACEWQTLPLGDVPAMAQAADIAWKKALLNEAWASQRAQVRDLYIASDPEMKSFSKLEES